MRKLLFFILVLLSFQNCITTPDLIKQEQFTPAAFSLNAFNGTYQNKVIDTDPGISLWNALRYCKTFKDDTLKLTDKTLVNINYDNKNKLQVILKERGVPIYKTVFKVKRRGNYISVKRNLFFVPVPFLFFWHNEAKVILSNDTNGNLHLNFARKQFVWILMAGSVEQEFNESYKRVD